MEKDLSAAAMSGLSPRLRPDQVKGLQSAVVTFDRFLAPGSPGGLLARSSPAALVLLNLPGLERQLKMLGEISLATWPDVHWVNQLAPAVVRAQESLQAYRWRVGGSCDPANPDDGMTEIPESMVTYEESSELHRSIEGLRDLIIGQCPGVREAQGGNRKSSVSENSP